MATTPLSNWAWQRRPRSPRGRGQGRGKVQWPRAGGCTPGSWILQAHIRCLLLPAPDLLLRLCAPPVLSSPPPGADCALTGSGASPPPAASPGALPGTSRRPFRQVSSQPQRPIRLGALPPTRLTGSALGQVALEGGACRPSSCSSATGGGDFTLSPSLLAPGCPALAGLVQNRDTRAAPVSTTTLQGWPWLLHAGPVEAVCSCPGRVQHVPCCPSPPRPGKGPVCPE